MLDFEADDEVKGIDPSPHSPMPIDTYRHLHRQMIMLTIVVAGLLVFVVYGVVDAVWNGNLPEFCVATPTLLLLLWVLYKIIRGWVVAWPAVKPQDAPTSIRPPSGGH